ncbi:hypothetical protein BI364_14970 [Acidihalobacter yilgarnensis]|uniref:Phosphatidylethanolamine-binding protein n=1 Tax=Acidihalobacter yilgarnensis TaxID=2819280 RepID=A0A1D8IRE9_9GAMM|nr:hypothetical protein [Acidihalobacter yilgarnensis]AOU99069.1 hypothetical protein BI364_14970 [Acidihalobacter yilgarnensis]
MLYDLPPLVRHLGEGLQSPPCGAHDGLSRWRRASYGGSCPPIGRHRYFFRLYALGAVLEFAVPPERDTLLAAMRAGR